MISSLRSKRKYNLLALIFSFSFLITRGGEAAPCSNFEFSQLNEDDIFTQFEGAILRIKAGSEVGTAFLIDAKQGYVITAAHVVKEAIAAPTVVIRATRPMDTREYRLSLRKHLRGENVDLALLQLEPSDALSTAFPVDVSFRTVPSGARVYAMGYSRGGEDISKQRAEITKTTPAEGVIAKSAIYPGDSGSPLLSNSGMAVGIARARIDNQVAHYTPMSDALELLKGIPITPYIHSLDEKLRNNNIAKDDLSVELRPRRHSASIRNVELISWAAKIGSSSNEYHIVRAMFDCPIVPAFWHRTLDEAADLLKPIMSAALKAQSNLILAGKANELGRDADVEQKLSLASRELRYFEDVDAVRRLDERVVSRPDDGRCDAAAFFALDSQFGSSEEARIAFLLSATKGQYEEWKRSAKASVNFGVFSVSASYEAAKATALREAVALRLNRDTSFYSQYLAQSLSKNAAQMYSQCLALENKDKPGLRIWLDAKNGDYIVLNVHWVSEAGETQGVFDSLVLDNLTLVSKPNFIASGQIGQLVLKRNSASDGLVLVGVNKQRSSYVVVRDSMALPMLNTDLVSGRALNVSTAHSGSMCSTVAAEDCVTPSRKGGFLLTGTGRLVDFKSTVPSQTTYTVTEDTPDRICIKLVVAPGACEIRGSAEGRVSAIERVP